MTHIETEPELKLEDTEKHDKVLNTFRCLVADLCQQYDGGHPGGAMSMAAIGLALYRYVMIYSPLNPQFFNRDRLVLSNGHVCLWQYIFMHLTRFKCMNLEQLKSYHSAKRDSVCPGSTLIQNDGIDASTGALGQGVANATGMAVAAKHLGSTYNRPGHVLVDNMIWCTVGDGCLQEGVALEAIQLAGHWRLDNLAILYDNNQVTCCGSVDVTCSEDINAKMGACGWHVVDVFDGVDNVSGIVQALLDARANVGRPTFINVRTIIGYGSSLQGQAKTHGDALGVEDVASVKTRFGMNPYEFFKIDTAVYEFFENAIPEGRRQELQFEQRLNRYGKVYPELAKEFRLRMEGEMTGDWRKYISRKEDLLEEKVPTRQSAALLCASLAKNLTNFMVGTTDLRPAVNMSWEGHVAFQYPDLRTVCGLTGDYTGRYMHCGVREHAMSLSNIQIFAPSVD